MNRDAIRVEGGPIRSLIDAIAEKLLAYRYRSITGDIQILLAEEDSMWSRSHPSAILVFEFEDNDSCKVNLGVTEGFGRWMVGDIREFIEDFARKNGLRTSNLNADFEIPYSPSIYKPTPKSFLKSCVRCGKDIPIASEECDFCGAHQPDTK
ncbi:MAG: hypothetical protein WED04_13310 [Promethearchaeati archaeon SRVP18_Atabeyarchaeia-1]